MSLNWFFGVNHLNHIIAIAGDNAYLIDILVFRFDADRKHRGLNESVLQPFLTDGLDSVNKDVATFGFMLVLGESWASCELGRVLFIGLERFKEPFPPIPVKHHQDFLAHLGW